MFDKNLIIPDRIITDFYPFSVSKFLQEIGSPLSSFQIEGKTAAHIIEDACRRQKVDPRFILVKLQVEQSLLFQTPSQEKLDWALGYGCLDSGERIEKYRGFAVQIEAAATGIKGYLDPNNQFYIGNKINKEWKVGDGIVICKNAATAALYRYTPWIGDKDFGSYNSPFGNYLFYKVWTSLLGPVCFEEEPLPDTPVSSKHWRIIAPPDNWRNPLSVSDDELKKFEQLVESLRLIKNKDYAQKKLYLGLPPQSPVETGIRDNTLKYPSGEAFPIVDDTPWLTPHTKYWAPHREAAAPLIKFNEADKNKRLSTNFLLGEFVCKDPSYDLVRISPKLIDKLEEIRKEAGGFPLYVTSAYRPYPYNRAISGAASNSYHIDGAAADIYINEISTSKLSEIAKKVIGKEGGVGIYFNSGFVHVDVRGYEARW